ncbi:bacteriocin immunity protein [Streptococcus mitis]|uniref:Bacteriocin immunity protein n=1 Tax=Streptococcus mitis TaxID=28037 RepID=A0A1X1KYG0_STRMT|nr:bacteriocin immunity protein [Streptococcus mitis]ORP04349.1 bacteriocin immunity protein [Streptococcus mitis]
MWFRFCSPWALDNEQPNLNLNTLLPKLATICPLLGITLNVALHVIRIGSLVSFNWQWTLVGLLFSAYFGIFRKDLSKNNQNYT